ncbi:hypothetical protein GCM10010503_55620 [Streptomyces lucensis JCM 4490]|uniref:Uncharacterized protein n=1 Tax=Streptomyces lucensis JCM 4490 TaxID=1306176 RepID=A0A918JBM8_9ACTN|nr:hypothetical protein [Streptomyces lucensis]GGW71106.1 hypothetical protein GCM10010503_55620 [Streptomyces lucensis JCM 4490]
MAERAVEVGRPGEFRDVYHRVYRGHGRALPDALLAGRDERFAVLAASTRAPAHDMYLRWGWAKAGELAGPPYGVALLALPLTT